MCGDIVVQVSTGNTVYTGKAHFDNINQINTQIYNATVPIEFITRFVPVDSVSTNVTSTHAPMGESVHALAPIVHTHDVMPTHAPMGESVGALTPEPLLSDASATPVCVEPPIQPLDTDATRSRSSDTSASRRCDPVFDRATNLRWMRVFLLQLF